MNKEVFIQSFKKFRSIDKRLLTISEVLNVHLHEGLVGEIYNLFLELMIPEDTDDHLYDMFYRFMVIEPTDKELENLYDNIYGKGENHE